MVGMTGILLVHGSWHGPWCWDHFAVRLSECGHDVGAVQLRGHDQRQDRIWHRVRSYVDDLARAAAAFPDDPVIVGHSLGGLVVQNYLERNAAPGAVLMASIPPGGTMGLTARLIARHPAGLRESQPPVEFAPVRRHSRLGARAVLHRRHSPGDRRRLLGPPAGRVVPGVSRHDAPCVAAAAPSRGSSAGAVSYTHL